jgi:hypothetical protein
MGFGLGLGAMALGGLAGAFAPSGKANFVNPNFLSQFKGPMGTSTREGFKFSQDPNRQAAVDFSNQQLQGQLANVFAGASPERISQFQNAFIDARRPQLEEALTQQKQALEAGISGQGRAGSSAALFSQGRQGELANRQRSELFNQGIMGGEALANQALQQNLTKFDAGRAFSQQDIGNQLQAFNQTQGAFDRGNQLELQKNQLLNQLAQKRAAQSGNKWKNIIGGIAAGASLGQGFGGSFSDLFSGFGGGGLSGSAASAPDSFRRAFGDF